MRGVKRKHATSRKPFESPMGQYSFDRPYPQQFSLPHPMVIYMIKQHKPLDLFMKFIKLCKFAYAKNRIVPVSKVTYRKLKTKPHYWTAYWNGNYRKKGKMELGNWNFKLWIVSYGKNDEQLSKIFSKNLNAASKFAPKIYRCEANMIINDQNMSFDDFILLTRGPKVSLRDNVIKYSDGSVVPFECILENLLHVSSLAYKFSPPENDASLRTPENIKNIMDVLARPSNQIHTLYLSGLTETFDIDLFTPFLLKKKNIRVNILFGAEVSESFKQNLEKVPDQVLETFPFQGSRVIGSPFIDYYGISFKKRNGLWMRYSGSL